MVERVELGRFLRTRRDRIRPSDVGLPPGTGQRRTPGLRREELATLAGVSVDYYIRLEQGKETNPGPAVVDALARALRLDEDETAHLRAMADRAAHRASSPRPSPSRTVRPGVHRILEALRPCPAYVLSRGSDLLAGNPAGLRLLYGITDWPAERRNTLRFLFLHPAARDLYPDWERVARESAAHLRTVVGADPDAPDLIALVGELIVKSPDFARMWEHYDVRVKASGRKSLRHPLVGPMTLSYEAMTLDRTDGQRLLVYQAEPGTPDHDAMVLLDMADSTEPAAEPVIEG